MNAPGPAPYQPVSALAVARMFEAALPAVLPRGVDPYDR